MWSSRYAEAVSVESVRRVTSGAGSCRLTDWDMIAIDGFKARNVCCGRDQAAAKTATSATRLREDNDKRDKYTWAAKRKNRVYIMRSGQVT